MEVGRGGGGGAAHTSFGKQDGATWTGGLRPCQHLRYQRMWCGRHASWPYPALQSLQTNPAVLALCGDINLPDSGAAWSAVTRWSHEAKGVQMLDNHQPFHSYFLLMKKSREKSHREAE